MLTGLNSETFAVVNHVYRTKDVFPRQKTSEKNGAKSQTMKVMFNDLPFIW